MGGHGQNGCDQPDHRPLKLTVSGKCTDKVNIFFYAGANSGKLKVVSIVFEWV